MIPGFDDTLKNAVVPASPASAGNAPSALHFPGMSKPTTDMQAVRDGRRSTLQSYLVDLSVARSIAAGTALQLGLQGNVFMSDPLYDLTGVAQAGIARVHFQDVTTNNAAPGTYCTVLPTAIYRVPFTQVLVENYAQAGKFLYIVYGTDIDVVPGGSQQVSATIINTPTVKIQDSLGNPISVLSYLGGFGIGQFHLLTRDMGFAYGTGFTTGTAMAANTAQNVFAAASNVNGAIIWRASNFSRSATVGHVCGLLAKSSAPATPLDGQAILATDMVAEVAGAWSITGKLEKPIFLAAGLGAYFISNVAESNAYRTVFYTLL